jgi:hypothetical protein
MLKAYGSYLTYRGKALNPEDVKIAFADEKAPTGESLKPFLTVMGTVKEILGRKSLLERIFG